RIMEHPGQWAISAVLAAVFVAANCVNVSLLLQLTREADEESRRYPIVLIGGLGGAMSFALAPSAALRGHHLRPLVVDLRTGAHRSVLAAVLLRRVWKARNWIESVPFVHYYFEREAPVETRYPKERAIVGCLLGTAVGDAMGLACEGMSRRRQARMFPDLGGY